MKKIIAVLLSSLLFMACNRQGVCREQEQAIPAEIIRISGPDTLELGKTVPLIIEVAGDDLFCVKRAEGFIIKQQANFVQIGASLIHTGDRKDNGCDCNDDLKLHTLIYFTPNVAGNYIFSQHALGLTNSWQDSTAYRVTVR